MKSEHTLQGELAYDSEPHHRQLCQHRIEPVFARRNTPHGSGQGVHHWVVDRTMSGRHQLRRLRIRNERPDDIHQALLTLGGIVIGAYDL